MQQQLWKTLLELNRCVREYRGDIHYCYINYTSDNTVIAINKPLKGENIIVVSFSDQIQEISEGTIFHFKNRYLAKLISPGKLDRDELCFLQFYLPYCFLSQYAAKLKRTIAVAHFAQTLDGRIATNSGNSRWIGNKENLVHAHRMRALCDGILVGNRTIKVDKPKLTVRHVPGKNPHRIVLGSTISDYSSLLESSLDPVLVLSSKALPSNGLVKSIQLVSKNGKIDCKQILEYLFAEGIYTIYIEGGAITTSNFINDQAIDILQLHFSPLLFGSGKSGVILPDIPDVNRAIKFDHFYFQPIGDTVMFVGQLNAK